MSGLRVQLFGRLHVWRDGVLLKELEAKALELFAYLLIYRERPHLRDALADLLWADAAPERVRKYLRQTLWQLQGAVGGAVAAADRPPVLRIESEWVQVDPEADVWVDAAELDAAFAATRDVRGRDLDPEQAEALRQAVSSYRGDLLEGWYHDWCVFERERLQSTYLAMLDKLMEHAEAAGAFDEGIAYGNTLLRLDRARERTHRRLMRLHALGGDRTGAIRQFERCSTALREELDVPPSPRTLALLAQIRADRIQTPTPADGPTSETTGVPLPDVLTRLQQLEGALTDFQHDLRQDIAALTHTMRQQA
jgi:DNA-binding SARP family transcriptional activator